MEDSSGHSLWTVVALRRELYAIPAEDVETMVMLPRVTKVPDMPSYVRGVFVLRGRTVPVVDLRTRLGMQSLEEETEQLIAMLDAREQDHRDWLAELEASVKERREFTLTTDAHKCKFGQWYDKYKTDNLLLQTLLRKFDAPHKRTHGIAAEVLALEKSGDSDGAQKLIAKTRDGDLAEMLRLFEQLRNQIRESNREIAIVLSDGVRSFAVAVDSVETVSRLAEDVDEQIAETGVALTEAGLLGFVGKLDRTGQLVITLATAGIVGATPESIVA